MRSLLTLTALLAVSGAAFAQSDYPTRPIRLISLSSAGSGGDAISRMYADKLAPILKSPLVVENKPGAGGAIALEAVARAQPDGYTIGLGGFSSNVLLPIVREKMPYDTVKDFAPIGQIGTAAILMLATNDFPASNLKEFIAQNKKHPEGQMYASWGVGSTGHFCGELVNQRVGTKLVHVPYKAASSVVNDMLGGQIKLAFLDMATASPLVKSGRLKALGSCVTRSPSLPEVRGLEEDGVTFSGQSPLLPMWAFYAPAKTPKPVMDKLTAAFKQVTEMPDVKEKLVEFGVKVEFVPGEQYRAMLAAGLPQWKDIATRSNIKIED